MDTGLRVVAAIVGILGIIALLLFILPRLG